MDKRACALRERRLYPDILGFGGLLEIKTIASQLFSRHLVLKLVAFPFF
jgi:hypothetical protein